MKKKFKVDFYLVLLSIIFSLFFNKQVNEMVDFMLPKTTIKLKMLEDEEKGIVQYINNSDKTLKIRTWTLKEFNQRWDGWICVVYADEDIVPKKYTKIYPIPIIDRIKPQGDYKEDYIAWIKQILASSRNYQNKLIEEQKAK